LCGDCSGKGPELVGRDVVPEPGPGRMEIAPVPCEGKRLLFIRWDLHPIADIQLPPLLAVACRDERVVVLEELPERDQELADIEDLLDPFLKPLCGLLVINPEHVTVIEPDGRALDRVDRH